MSRGATARLFVAVDPPVWASEQLAEWARGVAASARAAGSARGSLRLLHAHSLHLTVCFLGSRPVGEVEALAAALAPCAERAVELSVGAPLWLPARRPHALAVEIHDGDGGLLRVHERVVEALCGVSSWQPERRRFRPHVTLARVRGGARRRPRTGSAGGSRAGSSPREQSLPATPRLSFTPEAIVLYRSWLTPEGAIYEALASSELAVAGR